MAIDDAGENIGEVRVGIDAVQFACFDQRRDVRPMLCATIGTSEERILTVEGDGADGSLHDVVVDLDAAIVDEERQAFPPRQGIADRLRQSALLTDRRELFAQPWFEGSAIGRLVSCRTRAPLIWATSTQVFLDSIEGLDPLERFVCDRRRIGRGKFV